MGYEQCSVIILSHTTSQRMDGGAPVETPTIDQMLEFVKGHRSCGASCMSSRRLIYPGSSLLAWQKATQRLMELAAALLRKC